MKRIGLTLSACIVLALWAPTFALSQDKDDDLKPDQLQRIEAQVSDSAAVEKQHPKAAEEIRIFMNAHFEHANALDMEAYLNDIYLEKQSRPDLIKDYTKRAFALKNLHLQLLSIEFAEIQRRSATVHTRQRSTYISESGENVVDDVIVSYKLMRDDNNAWKILLTERRRLSI